MDNNIAEKIKKKIRHSANGKLNGQLAKRVAVTEQDSNLIPMDVDNTNGLNYRILVGNDPSTNDDQVMFLFTNKSTRRC